MSYQKIYTTRFHRLPLDLEARVVTLGYAGYKFNVLPIKVSLKAREDEFGLFPKEMPIYKKSKCRHTFLIHGILKGSITAKCKRPRPD